ncbi:hypothetical protein YWIDRAFT_08392 [Streptomyces sp. SceaMP-e96]|uniref:hypothetical protein n=1 Tax=unclassified Streptomyces TaxID=2593676 RepID=UPI000823E505|nr:MULTISPECIES: hypothetical protein [unclassified Streptomyces]MYT18649.1 hypothetical protein [Streptomyces sp. SID4951]SCK59275.1 hypothetical protein YWIDRAFT_08392 [Streptomyces sp. SceaMP-e96]
MRVGEGVLQGSGRVDAAFAACTYVTDWVAAKLRWSLTADGAEKTKLKQVAASCPNAKVTWKVAR